ncbi:PREDICTED: CD109 antigen-like isoform X2 [Rhagoletis zephyria]|uniref:CD109 antigen-like isoform X2 n=1 Tax=Rhagoletis zephyria TaxID=28612 RepID=UPI0008117EFF|nr:PREDICTED: CD109 antigen-like isoform X2 [Rhagoletis zephyria]
MKRLILLALCVTLVNLSALVRAEGQGRYSIVGPGTLHPDNKYTIGAVVYQNEEPVTLKVGLEGPNFEKFETIELQPDESRLVEFDVPALEDGKYNLTAEGVSGLIFKNTTRLNFEKFHAITKIQTDKGKYKPGDKVNFRVLFLDENLKPAKAEKDAVIWFEDGKRNIVKECKNIELKNGVFTGEFQISEFAVRGFWRLIVKNGRPYNEEVYFEVDKYVLPKYEIKLDATDAVSVRDGDVNIVVRANYTFGKPVEGKVTAVLGYSEYYSQTGDEKIKSAPTLIKSADMVNGKAKLVINVKDFKDHLTSDLYATSLVITSTLEEANTGVKLNATKHISVFPYRYSISCVSYDSCYTYHADKESEVLIQVNLVDGTVVTDTNPIEITFLEKLSERMFWRRKENQEETTTPKPTIEGKSYTFNSQLNGTGFAKFTVKLAHLDEIEDYQHYYEATVKYLDETRSVSNTFQYREPKNVVPQPEEKEPTEWFKLSVNYAPNTYLFNSSQIITITVNSSEPLSYFIYDVVGRGNILEHQRVVLPENTKIYNITLPYKFAYAPYARIYAYYVDNDGEFHYAESSFSAETELQNKIEVAAPSEVKPGDIVPLHIRTAPHSFVGLVAIDQSVLLLAGNNAITSNDFRWRIGSYDTSTPWLGGSSYYPGTGTGVVTLTNADYFYNWTQPEYQNAMPVNAERDRVFHSVGAGGGSFKAGVGVYSTTPSPAAPQQTANIRKDFRETWLFTDIEDTQTEEFDWSEKIPDTITSWVLTAFAVNPDKGLGVMKDSIKIKTFQPFFMSPRLPYSVKRGEVINTQLLVFNYLDKALDVAVTLDNTDGEYDFTDVSNEIISEPKRVKNIRVPAQSSAGVSFMIRPKVIGDVLLKYTAISPIAGDALHKALKVVPEGVTQYVNRAYFVNLKDALEFKQTFELVLPQDVVPDSEHIEVSAVGDILGPLLNNLDRLVRLPTGCAEQTASSFVPNYVVLEYLNHTNKLTPALQSKIQSNLLSGYQNILNFRLDDGSFSSFGRSRNSDRPVNGSTWLTAYIVRSLNQAKSQVKVDENVLKDGLKYLVSQQAENGSFLESNDFFFRSYREPLTLTASVLLTLVEAEELSKPYEAEIEKGFKYILENLGAEENLHVKAITVYALNKIGSPTAAAQLEGLSALAKTADDRKWWSNQNESNSKLWWRWSSSSDVEITSYVLLTLFESGKATVDDVLPVIRWLVAQRNSYGGFASTQDTVLGLKALMKFADLAEYEAASMGLDVTGKGEREKRETIHLTEDNGLLTQTIELPQKTLSVDLSAKGKGAALVQIAYQYNVYEKEKQPAFKIDAVVNKEAPAFKLDVDVCVQYTGESEATNMALLEISLPSGYVADEESFKQIEAVQRVRQVEGKQSNTLIVVYFESLSKDNIVCVPIEAFKVYPVADQKPATLVLFDYYDTAQKVTEYYTVSSNKCDICADDEECKACAAAV